jgi:hypothetical protein
VEHTFDLMHLDLWASPVVSVSGSKYYLVILDDFTHYLGTFPLKLKSDTFTTLSNFFAYVSNQFGRKIKAIQCDNRREFNNSSTPDLPPVEWHTTPYVVSIHIPAEW